MARKEYPRSNLTKEERAKSASMGTVADFAYMLLGGLINLKDAHAARLSAIEKRLGIESPQEPDAKTSAEMEPDAVSKHIASMLRTLRKP